MLFVRCRRFPILCLVLSNLVASPDYLPAAPIAPSCAEGAGARCGLGRDGASLDRPGAHPSLRWERDLPVLDDGEDVDGRLVRRDIFPAPATLAGDLPSLVPSSTLPVPCSTSLAAGVLTNDPPLRC